jgi:hypothetical protein
MFFALCSHTHPSLSLPIVKPASWKGCHHPFISPDHISLYVSFTTQSQLKLFIIYLFVTLPFLKLLYTKGLVHKYLINQITKQTNEGMMWSITAQSRDSVGSSLCPRALSPIPKHTAYTSHPSGGMDASSYHLSSTCFSSKPWSHAHSLPWFPGQYFLLMNYNVVLDCDFCNHISGLTSGRNGLKTSV